MGLMAAPAGGRSIGGGAVSAGGAPAGSAHAWRGPRADKAWTGSTAEAGTHSPGRDGLDQGTSTDLGPGSAVFLLRIVRGISFKGVWTEWAASGRNLRALWARGQWREVVRSERGPRLPALHQARAGGSEVVLGIPWGAGCSLGVRRFSPVT